MITVGAVLDAALEAHRAGRIDRAAVLYRLVLLADPAHPDGLHLYGLICGRGGDQLQAAVWMTRGLQINDTLASRHADYGHVLSGLGRSLDAAAAYSASLARRSDQPEIALALARMRQSAGNAEAAFAAYRHAVVLQPQLSDAWYEQGVLIYGGSLETEPASYQSAVKQFRRTSILRHDHRLAWINQGIILYLMGDLEAAYHACRQALLTDPGCERITIRLGQVLLGLGKVDAALAVLSRAAVLVPNDQETASTLDRAQSYRRLARWSTDPALPAGLAVRGTFRNTSGYAFMVRQFVRQLDAAGMPLHLLDVPISFLKAIDEQQRDPFFESFDRPVRARTLLNFVIPTLAEPVPGIGSIIFSMSETQTVPPNWVRYSLRHSHLIVPTLSSAEAWMRGGFPSERIRLCPLGVDPRPLSAGIAPRAVRDVKGRLLSDYRVRVANISDFTLRKNLDGLLRVWLQATRSDDDAALLLKIGKGTPGESDRIAAFLATAAASVGKPLDAAAPVFVLSGAFSDDEMMSLLAGATHYWSMSHGEGWDLPMTQAGAMGLTLIAPRHSAYTTYLDDDVALMLPVHSSPGLSPYVGLEWWSPDEAAAIDAIAGVVRNGLQPPNSARSRLIEDFSWKRAGERLIATLQEVGGL